MAFDLNIQSNVYDILFTKYDEECSTKYAKIIIDSVTEGLKKVWRYGNEEDVDKVVVENSTDEMRKQVFREYVFQILGQYMVTCNAEKLTKSITEDTIEWWDTAAFDTFKQIAIANIKMHTEGLKIEKCDLPCRNNLCKSDKCVFWLEQTRSGDEGMTTFVLCTVCQKRYRLG